MTAELILTGRVLGAGACGPPAEAVAIARGRVIAMGGAGEVRALRGSRTEVLGESGAAIVPGFIDAHLHFLALARRSAEVDCSPARSLAEVLARLGRAAAERPAGTWIRAHGFDEFFVDEHRRPSLVELDHAAARHPLRLLHRTGHLALLNTAALQRLDLAAGGEPQVERDGCGEPTGIIYEPGPLLRGRIPRLSENELDDLSAAVSDRLLAAGITSFHDPTPGQDWHEIAHLRRLVENGRIQQRVRAYGTAACFPRAEHRHPLPVGAVEGGAKRFRHCGVKLVLTEGSDGERFSAELAEADRSGAQVAIHAVEGGPLAVAVEGLTRLGRDRVRLHRHRLEHAALCPPALARVLGSLGATIVTHPDFVFRFGEKYRAEIPPEQHDWLYPLRSLLDLGLRVAFGSDAPIAPANPLSNLRAAVERRTAEGHSLGRRQVVSVNEALAMHTSQAAEAARDEDALGRLRIGAPADAVLLSADPTLGSAEGIAAIEVRATIVNGRIAWRA